MSCNCPSSFWRHKKLVFAIADRDPIQHFVCVRQSVHLSVWLPVCLSVYLSVHWSICLCPTVRLCIYLSACQFICLPVCRSCLSVFFTSILYLYPDVCLTTHSYQSHSTYTFILAVLMSTSSAYSLTCTSHSLCTAAIRRETVSTYRHSLQRDTSPSPQQTLLTSVWYSLLSLCCIDRSFLVLSNSLIVSAWLALNSAISLCSSADNRTEWTNNESATKRRQSHNSPGHSVVSQSLNKTDFELFILL